MLRETGHRNDSACEDNEITCTSGKIAVSDCKCEAFGIAELLGVVRK